MGFRSQPLRGEPECPLRCERLLLSVEVYGWSRARVIPPRSGAIGIAHERCAMRAIIGTMAGFVTALALFSLSPNSPAAPGSPAPLAASLAAAETTGATAADSAQALRFWGYWQQDGSKWAFATTGPAQAKPEDGDVQGWRFAESKGEAGTPPRAKPDFDQICKDHGPQDGRKRVAVVIDYGEASDAPDGQKPPAPKTDCAVVATAATGADVLAAVTEPQTDSKGLVCAIDTFPANACGGEPGTGPDKPSDAAPPADAAGGASATGSTGLIGGLIVVVVVAAAGIFFAVRRRRAAGPPAP
jgi:hypothetical protein